MAKVHRLNPDSKSLHGFFSKDLEPALEIDSGDTVHFQTLDSAWGVEKRKVLGQPRKRFTDLQPHRRPKQFGHSLIGPVFIRNAKPGQTLEITINEVVPGNWGWTSAGGFPSYWNQKLGMVDEKEVMLDFELDSHGMTGKSQFGDFDFTVTLQPFMGIMGMPPSLPGEHTTISPRVTGGNIDCKELQAGSTLFLPIEVEGGLFSTGDGHALQGDGEVSGPALECPMEKVSLTFTVLDNFPIERPIAKTKDGWITMAFHKNLEEAMWIALNDMLQLISYLYNISRTEAYAYASLVVDLRITQIVNTSKGVHAFLPFGALR
ncbi:acetamidase/formamidase family protein [Paucisalibacillus globulus]|jgi:acetamidase/formamidase|uniref:acetamidase/formamidase family protein n=1 Tax=Paucisalibacillus globulus TaxID=351095 RepID=UPI000404E7BA|nr:acetamidase/formamidase family protein [Paucisalibacillus globulus]